MRQILPFLIILLPVASVNAQKLQVGASFCYSNIFYQKTSKSIYDENIFDTRSMREFGVGLKLKYTLIDGLRINSGFLFQPRSFNFIQDEMGYDQQSVKYIGFRYLLLSYEVPVVFEKRIVKISESIDFAVHFGGIFTINKINDIAISSEEPYVAPNFPLDTIYFDISVISGKPCRVGADLYFALSLNGSGSNWFSLELSYQYSLSNTNYFDFNSSIENQGTVNQFSAHVDPRLSYISLRLSVFPDWRKLFTLNKSIDSTEETVEE